MKTPRGRQAARWGKYIVNNRIETVPVDQLVGQMLGRCRVERLLGRGRLSAVFLAQQPVQKRPVAITAFLIPEQFSAQARSRFVTRFTSEAEALTTLQHPHLLPVYAYGEQYGYPYLVTPYVTAGSLADVIKQQGRCASAYTVEILEQVAAALDYAHNKGVIHGTLKPANILLSGEKSTVQVAGCGLLRLLEMRGIEQSEHPYAHLLSIAGTFLGSSEYIAPEFVQGQPVDARADIYALGILLFELLSGKPPFTGTNALEVAVKHVQQPLPSLRMLAPDVPAALESVVMQALERNPAQRFQHAGDLAAAFARAFTGPVNAARLSASSKEMPAEYVAGEEQTPTGKWQLMPPVITGHVPSINKTPATTPPASAQDDAGWQFMPPIVTGSHTAIKPAAAAAQEQVVPPSQPLVRLKQTTDKVVASPKNLDDIVIDPFEYWSRTFTLGDAQVPTLAEKGGKIPTNQLPSGAPPAARRSQPGARGMSRRQVMALLAGGGVAAAGALALGGVSLAHLLQRAQHPQATHGTTVATQAPGITPTHGATGPAKKTPPAGKPTAKPTGKPNPTPTAHTQPTPAPTQPPAHTGTVIGSTNMGTNSSKGFTNPADGNGSLLIHLPNGNFVAYEKACTHENVPVNYDVGSHKLICPAHGAIFDPANGASVVQGPANRPLPSVTIRVNADGTITTG